MIIIMLDVDDDAYHLITVLCVWTFVLIIHKTRDDAKRVDAHSECNAPRTQSRMTQSGPLQWNRSLAESQSGWKQFAAIERSNEV